MSVVTYRQHLQLQPEIGCRKGTGLHNSTKIRAQNSP